jgi:hypothetical protein
MLTDQQKIEAYRKYCQEIKFNISEKQMIDDAKFIFEPVSFKDPIKKMKTINQGVEWLRAMADCKDDEYERSL